MFWVIPACSGRSRNSSVVDFTVGSRLGTPRSTRDGERDVCLTARSRQAPYAPEEELSVYAIVRAGGRQEKVAVGDVVTMDKVKSASGGTVQFPVLMLVDEGQITSSAADLANASVTGEVVEATKGPKIDILRFHNKTGYRRRQGHRAQLLRVRITGIETGK